MHVMTNNDRLTQLHADLVSAIRDWRSKWELLSQRLANPKSDEERHAAVDDLLSDPTARITLCSEAILQITDDRQAEVHVTKLDGLMSAEIQFWRAASAVGAAIPEALKQTPVYQVLGKVVGMFVAVPAAARHAQLVAAMAEAEAYFSKAA
jgi:hypothetical protein